MSSFTIYAGQKALSRIAQEGLHRDQFDTLVGASGGPKWFVLHGLDRYLFSEFLPSSKAPLTTIGSSAGAWRICCLATVNPVAAIDRLAERYSQERYSDKPTVEEITSKAAEMLLYTLGETGASEIVTNQQYLTHIIVDRCRGLSAKSSRAAQTTMLASAMIANGFSRKTLSLFFERTVFSNAKHVDLSRWRDLRTTSVTLAGDNVFDAMMATGSIPFILEGVTNIAGAKEGVYWDGGITDYHFDVPFNDGEKLVLYPHFSAAVIPGWFDKHVPWHKVSSSNYSNVVLLVPSRDFIASLPFGKIPDRDDFAKFDYDTRLDYWQTVLERSREIADEFAECVRTGNGLENVRPFDERDR